MSDISFARRVVIVVGIGVLALGLWQLRNIVLMIVLAVIIAVSLDMPTNRLRRIGVRNSLALFLSVAAVFTMIFAFLAWIMPTLVVEMADVLSEFPDAYDTVREQYSEWHSNQTNFLQEILPTLDFDNKDVRNLLSELTAFAPPLAAEIGNALAQSIANLGIIIVVAIFLLLEPKNYVIGLITLIPEQYRDRTLEILIELRLTVTTWMTALTFSITITTLLVWITLGWLLGVPNALALGVIAGVSTIIPNIGAVIPVIPITIFTLADDPAKLPLVIPAYLMIQLTESNILTPSIVKRELNIPAAAVLLFQLIAAYLFGFFGVLLAVPMLALIITLVRELYVYDTLGMRDVSIDIANTLDGYGLKLVTTSANPEDPQELKIMTQTFTVVRDRAEYENYLEQRPEDWPTDTKKEGTS